MDVNVIGHSYITYSARWVMGITSALQPAKRKVNYSHQFLNSQAVEILRNDGYEGYANILEYYKKDLNHGVNWADLGWKNINHYFDPVCGKGILKFANAIDEVVLYFNRAVRCWRDKQYGRAMFYLGTAVHIVQDMCVPQHATNSMSPGHKRFENWFKNNFGAYGVISGGRYGRCDSPAGFAYANAIVASRFKDDVKLSSKSSSYHEISKIIAPMAQYSTAEFFYFFFAHVEVKG
jgi:phospholipase C